MDEKQTITLFNDGAEKIFGYSSAEMIGQPISVLIPARFIGAHDGYIKNFGSSSDSLRAMNERGSIFGLRKDGTEFPAEASISKFEVAGEKVLAVRLRDITERKRAEEAARGSEARFAGIVRITSAFWYAACSWLLCSIETTHGTKYRSEKTAALNRGTTARHQSSSRPSEEGNASRGIRETLPKTGLPAHARLTR